MKLSDFSSVLQLGVGLHAGTALLQSIVEFASAPIFARLERLARVSELRLSRLQKSKSSDAAHAELLLNEINDLQGSLAVKRVQFFNEYKIAASVNTTIATLLYILLSWAAVCPDIDPGWIGATVLIAISALPAVGSILLLWWRWHSNTESIRSGIAKCQRDLFRGSVV